MRTCADCGVDISARAPAAYLCVDCATDRKRVRCRLECRERRKTRPKDYLPLHGSGRVPCTADCGRTFVRTPFNLSRLFCDACADFYRRERRRTAHRNYYARNRVREAARARERYHAKLRRAA